jgi:HEAT repeat protein
MKVRFEDRNMRNSLMTICAVCFLLAVSVFVSLNASDRKEDVKPLPKDVLPPPAFPGANQEDANKEETPKKEPNKNDTRKEDTDEEILRRAKLSTETEALLKFFQKRTLSENERPAVERLVRQLGSDDYRTREKAILELVARGAAVLELLRSSHPTINSLEMSRRVENAIQRIRANNVGPEVPAAVVRVLAQRKPAELVETLIEYIPYAENDNVVEEIRLALTREGIKEGKPHPRLLAALADRDPLRRATVAGAVGRAAFAQHKETLRKLLQDPDPLVRLRVAQTLAYARQPDVIPTLIDTIPDLPLNEAWQTEDFLLRLAQGTAPPETPMGNDKDARVKCRNAWQTWWKKHGDKVDLSKLEETPKMLGRTLIVLLDQNKVMELGRDNQPRWEVRGLVFPLDAQLIDDDRVLVAEYQANRVTERNSRSEVLWQITVPMPLMAQRLANGNTFVATDNQFHEFDKEGKEVWNVSVSDEGRKIMKAAKLPNGDIVCMQADARIVRYNAKGQEIKDFPISIGIRLFGGRIHVLPNGRVLVPHNNEGKIVEYDSLGKAVWEVAFEQPIAAMRLPNGNTLITSMNPTVGAVEVDRAGKEVWSYRDTTRVTRAIRR